IEAVAAAHVDHHGLLEACAGECTLDAILAAHDALGALVDPRELGKRWTSSQLTEALCGAGEAERAEQSIPLGWANHGPASWRIVPDEEEAT
ncbi:MAG: hypothetical protein ACRDYZ_07945, partial [Acidimicrobiales bacterium]